MLSSGIFSYYQIYYHRRKDMNELSTLFTEVRDNECITLEKDKVYEIAPEDSFHIFGLYFSNTATRPDENPYGERFCGIYLENRNNVVIDGNGAKVLIHGKMTPFVFKRCRNIVFKNLTIDHVRPTMSEFTITDCEKGKATFRINDEFLYRIDGNFLYWHSENSKSGKPYWEIPCKGPYIVIRAYYPETGITDGIHTADTGEYVGLPDIEKITEIEHGVLRVDFCDKEVLLCENSVVQTRLCIRTQTGGCIDECEGVKLDGITVRSINCFGILAQNSGNLLYDHVDCTPAEGRTITSDADFFHFSGCFGDICFKGCRAKGSQDDVMNIHGTHLRVMSYDRNNNSAVMRYCHDQSWGFVPYYPGDEVEFVSASTLLPYYTSTVERVSWLSDFDYLVVFSSLPENITAGSDVVENVTHTPSLTVRDCVFEQISPRGILCTTRKDVLIENNIFRNTSSYVLCVGDDANSWFESGRSGRVVFENNTVVNCCNSDTRKARSVAISYEPAIKAKENISPVHKLLIVRNNKFINTIMDSYTFRLRGLEKAEFSGNISNVPLIYDCDSIVECSVD